MSLPHVRVLPALLLACALLACVPGASLAATKPAASPVVTGVTPLQLRVGDRLTLQGRHFLPGRRTNTVVFKRDGRRAIFVKADRATRTRMTVVIPDKVAGFLASVDGRPSQTTFRVRVLARRFARTFTPLRRSPKISPAAVAAAPPARPSAPPPPPDCDGDGQVDAVDLDDDDDALADSAEAGYGTNPCSADTDGDGLRDAWEIESALDLNLKANFFPGKAPYPNPLFAGDPGRDFDGDGLLAREEHDMWSRSGRAIPLTYSDGDQDTTTGGGPRTPIGDAAHLDLDGDGWLTDDEKDLDGDRLGNWPESHGPMLGAWWAAVYDEEAAFFGHPQAPSLLDSAAVLGIPGRAPMYADADVDGDGLLDGADDQDHDGFTNEQELTRRRLEVDTDADGIPDHALRMNAYNPCLPDLEARTCTLHPPVGESWAPFDDSAGRPFDQGQQRLYLVPAWS